MKRRKLLIIILILVLATTSVFAVTWTVTYKYHTNTMQIEVKYTNDASDNCPSSQDVLIEMYDSVAKYLGLPGYDEQVKAKESESTQEQTTNNNVKVYKANIIEVRTDAVDGTKILYDLEGNTYRFAASDVPTEILNMHPGECYYEVTFREQNQILKIVSAIRYYA